MTPIYRLPILLLIVGYLITPAFAQRDTIFLNKADNQRGSSKVTGSVTGTSPDAVSIQVGGATQQIPTEQIKKIQYAGEPTAVDRARERMADGRYADAVTELGKIDETPSSTWVQQEIDFLTAAANAQVALSGGDITAQVAGQGINRFLQDHPQAYRFYPATQMMGQLLLAIDRVDLAEQQFAKMAESNSPEIQAEGLLRAGNAQLLQDNWDAAKATYEKLASVNGNSETIRQRQLAAQCQLARIQAETGDPTGAREKLEALIRDESEDNEMLFAYAYNALGICHEQEGNLKAAVLAYLHNELLFVTEHDARAESLFQLARLWPKLNDTDSASRARSTLLSRYRNTIWANRL